MSRRIVRVAVAVLILVIVTAAVLGGWRWWRASQVTGLERALEFAPAEAARFGWTDWTDVRAELGVSDLAEIRSEGFTSDLTSASTLGESAEALDEQLGLSPATVRWELLAQSEDGALVALGLPEDADVDELGDRLEAGGWAPPEDEEGVWSSDAGTLSQAGISPQFGHFRLLESEGVVLASDNAAFLGEALGDAEVSQGVADAADAAGEPLSAVLLTGRQACGELAMSQADPQDQQVAEQLIADAGPISPLSGFAITAQPGGDVRTVLAFENADQARRNADTRAALASGPAPGQGGTFPDRFELEEVRATDRVITMEMAPRSDYVLSDLSDGPVLFATC